MLPNSRILRIVLYAVVGIVFVGAIIWDVSRRFGVNPFDSSAIFYWGLVILVGIYVTARIAMIVERNRKGKDVSKTDSNARSLLSMFSGRNSREINRRMAARRERVAKAKMTALNKEKSKNE